MRVGNNIINYIKSDMHEGKIELLEVSSNLYSSQLNEYFGKVGIWLDLKISNFYITIILSDRNVSKKSSAWNRNF